MAKHTRAEVHGEGEHWYVRSGDDYREVVIAGPGRRVNSWNYTVLEGPDAGRMGTSSVFYGRDPASRPRPTEDAARPVGAISDFGFSISPGLRYRVTVRSDPHRKGYVARLSSEGVGTLMEPNGTTPSDALTRLARELATGDATDRKIAQAIARHAWFPLKL